MISRILAADVAAEAGQHVMIAGWLHRKRQLKSMTFLIVRDRSGLAQAVLTDPAAIDAAAVLPEETVIRVDGTVTASPQAPGGAEIISPTRRNCSPATPGRTRAASPTSPRRTNGGCPSGRCASMTPSSCS